ncbi:MAG: HD domain-containing protein [Candidatus Omnitrophica bacterium]|nr:HD domain-containing protein [Candidatus Omnitrophota bacterium]
MPDLEVPQKPKFDYQAALEDASKSMIRFRKPEHLIRRVIKMIDDEVGVSHTGILLFKEGKGSYELIDSKGKGGDKIPIGYIRLQQSSPLIEIFSQRENYLLSENGALIYDDIYDLLHSEKEDPVLQKVQKVKLAKTLAQMDLLRASVCIPSYFKKTLLGVLVLGDKISREKFQREEISFFVTLANDAAMAITNAKLISSLQDKIKEIAHLYEKEHKLFIHVSVALATAIDARDPYTHGHTERVTSYADAISDALADAKEAEGIKNFRESLHIAALLHDIGKIGVSDNILNKKGKLTPEEYEEVKEHSNIGAAILHPIRELGSDIIDTVRHHQERYDGSGYPAGLKGKGIPLMARIVAVADTFDALTTDRPYRERIMEELSVQVIAKGSGTQFDPDIVQAFLNAYRSGTLTGTRLNIRAMGFKWEDKNK